MLPGKHEHRTNTTTKGPHTVLGEAKRIPESGGSLHLKTAQVYVRALLHSAGTAFLHVSAG